MNLESLNFGECKPNIEAFKKKINECVSITYKKGVLRSAIGASVLVITALAAYVLRTGNFMPSDIFRQHISFSATILVCSAFGSIFSILNGLGWLKKSRSIAKSVDSQVNYYDVNSTALNKFLNEIENIKFSSLNIQSKCLFAYVDNKDEIKKQRKELKALSVCWADISVELLDDTKMANFEAIHSIKERFDLMQKNIQTLLNKNIDKKKIKNKINFINSYFQSGIQKVQEYIQSFDKNVITY